MFRALILNYNLTVGLNAIIKKRKLTNNRFTQNQGLSFSKDYPKCQWNEHFEFQKIFLWY